MRVTFAYRISFRQPRPEVRIDVAERSASQIPVAAPATAKVSEPNLKYVTTGCAPASLTSVTRRAPLEALAFCLLAAILSNRSTAFMLMRLLWFVLVALGGAALALQAVWNTRFRAASGSAVLTNTISVIITAVALVAVWVSGLVPRGSMPPFQSLPKWAWCGGFCAAYYLVVSLVALPRLGAAAVFCLVIAGQVITALLVDTAGSFYVARIPLNPSRIVGTVLVLVGVILIQKQ